MHLNVGLTVVLLSFGYLATAASDNEPLTAEGRQFGFGNIFGGGGGGFGNIFGGGGGFGNIFGGGGFGGNSGYGMQNNGYGGSMNNNNNGYGNRNSGYNNNNMNGGYNSNNMNNMNNMNNGNNQQQQYASPAPASNTYGNVRVNSSNGYYQQAATNTNSGYGGYGSSNTNMMASTTYSPMAYGYGSATGSTNTPYPATAVAGAGVTAIGSSTTTTTTTTRAPTTVAAGPTTTRLSAGQCRSVLSGSTEVGTCFLISAPATCLGDRFTPTDDCPTINGVAQRCCLGAATTPTPNRAVNFQAMGFSREVAQ